MKVQISLVLTALIFTGTRGLSATSPSSATTKTGQIRTSKKFTSPDGKLIAEVLPTGGKKSESRIQIFTKAGACLATKDFGSKDGEHGEGFCKGAWTLNSKFFVWSMESSGGHQPWHFPTYFFDRKRKSVESLDAKVGGITTSDFKLSAPDVVEGTRLRKEVEKAPFKLILSRIKE